MHNLDERRPIYIQTSVCKYNSRSSVCAAPHSDIAHATAIAIAPRLLPTIAAPVSHKRLHKEYTIMHLVCIQVVRVHMHLHAYSCAFEFVVHV